MATALGAPYHGTHVTSSGGVPHTHTTVNAQGSDRPHLEPSGQPSGQQEDAQQGECVMQYMDVKALYNLLQCLRSGGKEVGTMRIMREGMEVRFQDSSRTWQSSVLLDPGLFSNFYCPPGSDIELGIQINNLLDTVAIFAAAPSDTGLQIRYSEAAKELTFSMTDVGEDQHRRLTTHACVRAVELPHTESLLDYWQGPSSSFTTRGGYPKEIVEDLEWGCGDVEILLMGDPPRVLLGATGTQGSLQEEIPDSEVTEFHMALQPRAGGGPMDEAPEIRHHYEYRAIKAAFCNITVDKSATIDFASTKVQLDANGILKVSHIIKNPSLAGMDVQASLHAPSMQGHGQAVIVSALVSKIQGVADRDD